MPVCGPAHNPVETPVTLSSLVSALREHKYSAERNAPASRFAPHRHTFVSALFAIAIFSVIIPHGSHAENTSTARVSGDSANVAGTPAPPVRAFVSLEYLNATRHKVDVPSVQGDFIGTIQRSFSGPALLLTDEVCNGSQPLVVSVALPVVGFVSASRCTLTLQVADEEENAVQEQTRTCASYGLSGLVFVQDDSTISATVFAGSALCEHVAVSVNSGAGATFRGILFDASNTNVSISVTSDDAPNDSVASNSHMAAFALVSLLALGFFCTNRGKELISGCRRRSREYDARVLRVHIPQAQILSIAHHMPCCVCLEDLPRGATVRQLQCDHVFHLACIDKWVSHVPSCPLCKTPLPVVVDFEGSDYVIPNIESEFDPEPQVHSRTRTLSPSLSDRDSGSLVRSVSQHNSESEGESDSERGRGEDVFRSAPSSYGGISIV